MPCGESYYDYQAEQFGSYQYPTIEPCPVPASRTSRYCPEGSREIIDENGNVLCVKETRFSVYPSDTSSSVIGFSEVNPKAMGLNAVKLASVIGDALFSIKRPVNDVFTEVSNDNIKLITKERRNRVNTEQGMVSYYDKEIITASVKSVTEKIVIEVKSIRMIQTPNGQQRPVAPPEGEADEVLLQLKTALRNFVP